jgi:hypothetical protein
MDNILAKADNGTNLFNPPAKAGGNSDGGNLLNRNVALAHSFKSPHTKLDISHLIKLNRNAALGHPKLNRNVALAHPIKY